MGNVDAPVRQRRYPDHWFR